MKIIGISGVAGAGKDLFFEILSEKINCQRFALADELKSQIKEHCLKEYGIDPANCSRDQKDIIRPILVGHGLIKRNLTRGRYWIEELEPKIKDYVFDKTTSSEEDFFPCITDIRYNKYERDEVTWLKEEMNGILVHVSKFTVKNNKRVFVSPINDEETEQNPKLYEAADYRVMWEHLEGDYDQIKETLKKTVIDDFTDWMKKSD